MEVRKAYDLRGDAVKGSEDKALLRWHCNSDHLASFLVRWYYKAYGSNTWRQGGSTTVTLPNSLQGWYHTEITLPAAKAASVLKFRVDTRAKTHQVKYWDGTNKDGTAKYRTVTEEWFSPGMAESPQFSSPLYDATVKRAQAEAEKGGKWWKKATEALKDIAAIPHTGANAHKIAAKYEKLVTTCETAAKYYQQAYQYYADSGYTQKTSSAMKAAHANAATMTSNATRYKREAGDFEEEYQQHLADLAQEKIDARRASAKTYASNAAAEVKMARAYAKAGDLANEAKAWASAKSSYGDSADAWGKAYELSRASSDSEKRSQMNSKAQECERSRADAADAAKAKAELLREKSAKPVAPTLSVESLGNGKNRVTMDCSAEWTDSVVLERSHDNKSWAVVHEFSRKAPKDGGSWATETKVDDVDDGKNYWYRAFSQRKAVPSSSFSNYSAKVSVEGRPSPPTNFKGTTSDTVGQVSFSWKAVGSVGDEYEIVYTDLTGRNAKGEVVNAWQAGIPESEMHVYRVPFGHTSTTLNGLAPGAWWFRIRLRGDGGTSAWGHRYDWTKAEPRATIKLNLKEAAEPKLTAPTALKAARNASSGLVTLTWAGTLEGGESYIVQRSTNKQAWTKNIQAEISSTNYDGSYGRMYSFADLEAGKDHYFRLLKSRQGESVTASAAEGSSKYDAKTAFVKVPAPVAETVVAPTSLTATLSGTDAIVLKWASSQGVGESYEVQHAAKSAALTANDAGLITELKLSQYTASNSKQHTLTKLEAGSYAFRVRKVSASGAASAWSNIATASVPAQSAKPLTTASGLYARHIASSGVVELYWSGILEEGASYEIWSTSNSAAFANNIMDAITVTPVDELASGGNTTYKYGFSNLEKGKAWWFKLRKERDDVYTWGQAKAGDESFVDAQCVKVNVPAEPDPEVTTPIELAVEARNTTSLRVSWSDPGHVGDKYIVQCTDDLQAYDDNAEGAITQMEMTLEQASGTHVYSFTGLEPGTSYAVRVRKAVGDAVGEWTDEATAELPAEVVPDELAAPTVARLFSGYVDGDEVTLSWTHNSGSSSAQSAAQVAVTATDGGGASVKRTVAVVGEQNALAVPYGDMGAGGGWTVEVSVRTQGAVEGAWSPWSAAQRFSLHRRPALGITLSDGDGDHVGGAVPFTRFPLTVEVQATAEGGAALESTNLPVSYTFELTASRDFPVTSADGSQSTVAAGQRVFSARSDYGDEGFSASGWTFQVGAQDMRVADGAELVATASVVTAQGLRSEPQESAFTCSLSGEVPMPLALMEYRPGTMTATIAPACTLPDDSVEEAMWGVPDGFTCSENGYSATRAKYNGDGTATVEVTAPEGVEVLYVAGDPVNDVGGAFPVNLTVGGTSEVVAEGDIHHVEEDVGSFTPPANSEVESVDAKGWAEQDGTPTPDNPQEVRVCRGRNLIPFPYEFSDRTESGITFKTNADGSITITGTATANVGSKLNLVTGLQLKGTYTFSTGGTDLPSGFTIRGLGQIVNNSPLTIALDGTYSLFMVILSGAVMNHTIYPQLELGSTPTPYVPYGHVGLEVRDSSDELVSVTPIPLPSKGFAAALPDGTADALAIDSAGGYEWDSIVERIASYNDESVGNVYLSTTGQLTTGAEVYYKSASTTESGYIDLPELPENATITIPELAPAGLDFGWVEHGGRVEMTMALDGVLLEEPEEEPEDEPEGGDALTPDEAQALIDFEWEDVPEDADWEGTLLPEDADGGFDDEGYELRENTVLAVYRVNADGSTVEVASNIPNDGTSGCVDPHPSFGACTYRIVATDTETGISSVADAVLEVPEEDVVIQWGEQWAGDDYGEFQGERLVVRRNVEAGEEMSPKSALADIAGREHPAAFYGRGSSQTYNVSGVVVPMLESDVAGAVRRLGSYGGNVYVRDPDGIGYWANVASVRLSRARKTVGRAVSIAVTRVEGGL